MGQKSKGKTGSNQILIIGVTFLLGFLAGVGFTVFKLDGSVPKNEVQQASAPSTQLDPQQAAAITTLEQKVTATPEDYKSWITLGHLYFDTNQAEKAILAYTNSLKYHEGDANLYTDLGVMYRRVGQPQKAIESFDKASSQDALHIHSRLNKGIVLYYDLKDTEGAIASWKEVLKIDPETQLGDGSFLKDAIKTLEAAPQG